MQILLPTQSQTTRRDVGGLLYCTPSRAVGHYPHHQNLNLQDATCQ
jgi:hypothetical protein